MSRFGIPMRLKGLRLVQIGIGVCKDPLLVPIHDCEGVENCIIIFVISVFEAYKQWRLFYPIPTIKYFGSSIGSDYFWLEKEVLLNVEMFILVQQEVIKQEGFNNLHKRIFFCRDLCVCSSLHYGDSIDDDDVET